MSFLPPIRQLLLNLVCLGCCCCVLLYAVNVNAIPSEQIKQDALPKVQNSYQAYLKLSEDSLAIWQELIKKNPRQQQYLWKKRAKQDSTFAVIYQNLQNEFGQKKELPPNFELQALIALSHYPELKNTPIRFILKKAKVAHTSQPNIWRMLSPFHKRNYYINISTETTPVRDKMRLPNLGFDAQIGVLAHELGHTVDYLEESVWGLLCMGIQYPFFAFQKEMERATDKRVIEHNLGFQLLAWSKSVRTILEKDGRRGEMYLSPKEIVNLMEK